MSHNSLATAVDGKQPLSVVASRHSYSQILRSSAVIGGSSLVIAIISMVRTKALAVLLGPAGYGLLGAFGLIVDLARTAAQLGVNGSGVRQIAEAVGSEDEQRIARTVLVLRRATMGCAVLGTMLLAVFAEQISTLTFGTANHATAVALLSVAVSLGLFTGSQSALLQGMRRIGDLAKVGIIGAVAGTLVSVPMVFFLGEDGLVSSLIAVAAASAFASWWYARKVVVGAPVDPKVDGLAKEFASLFKLGLAFLGSGLLSMGAMYIVRAIVVRDLGLEAAGIYQAAWTLGGLYIGFILQALGADFYPRLVGVIADHPECNRVVNEQAQVSLLLSAPGVIATITFAPLAVYLLYSVEFSASIEVLRWICLGMAMRIVTWPLGFIIVAKSRQLAFLGTDAAWAVANVSLTWLFVNRFGINGTGIAFFCSYLLHAAIVYPLARRMTGFRWCAGNIRAGLCFGSLIAAVFIGFNTLPLPIATALGLIATVASGCFSIWSLSRLASSDLVPSSIRRFFRTRRFG